MSEFIEIKTTVATQQQAGTLANELVAAQIAGCVQVDGPIQSTYHWQGELCQDSEWRLTIKTRRTHIRAIESHFASEHPYDVPQFIVLDIHYTSSNYAQWLTDQTQA